MASHDGMASHEIFVYNTECPQERPGLPQDKPGLPRDKPGLPRVKSDGMLKGIDARAFVDRPCGAPACVPEEARGGSSV